ncbi:MAG: YHYH protein, partial [Phycisphaeraceae bacterium]
MRHLFTLALTACVAGHAFAHAGHDHAPHDDYNAATIDCATLFYVAAFDPPRNRVDIAIEAGKRIVVSNGIPEHKTGRFPTRGNPNEIREQSHRYEMPANPEAAERTTSVYGQPFGVALNGVPFDPGTAEVWSKNGRTQLRGAHQRDDLWNYDALSGKINLGIDTSNAHVQPTGAYHYHGIPHGLVANQKKQPDAPGMTLVGYAADGFPIYAELAHDDADDASSKLRNMKPSYRLKRGNRPGGDDAPGGRYDGTFNQDFEYVRGLGDLDECNGRTGVTPEYPDGTYYYVLTEAFPMIPRAFRGTPDKSF